MLLFYHECIIVSGYHFWFYKFIKFNFQYFFLFYCPLFTLCFFLSIGIVFILAESSSSPIHHTLQIHLPPPGDNHDHHQHHHQTLQVRERKHLGFPPGNKTVNICKICFDPFSYKTGFTATTSFHLKRKHNVGQEKLKHDEKSKTLSHASDVKSKQLALKDLLKLSRESARSKAITRAIGVFIAKDTRPFSIVDNVGFCNLLRVS